MRRRSGNLPSLWQLPEAYGGLLGPFPSVLLLLQWYNRGGRAPVCRTQKLGAGYAPSELWDCKHVIAVPELVSL